MIAGFFVNPLAGYGGPINNKGSDNLVLKNINDSTSIARADEFLGKINAEGVCFIVPYGYMGSFLMDRHGLKYKVAYSPGDITTASDTENFVRSMGNVDILCFAGGDGTARDILEAGCKVPVLGIPSGVKMYSSVFAMNIPHAAEVFNHVAGGYSTYRYAEVSDIDEEKYRNGILNVKTYGMMLIPDLEGIVMSSKAEYPNSGSYDIAEYIIEEMKDDTIYIIGPGSTCKAIVSSLGYRTNMLGFDLFAGKKLIAADLDEKELYNSIINKKSELIISIIGGQGFLLGRGNQQISGRIIEAIGFENITVISSPEKLLDIKKLYIDMNLNGIKLPQYIRVLTGYGIYKMAKLEA
ncbi:MAG: ATP-NAD kinase family protein [Ferroplasma sp.]